MVDVCEKILRQNIQQRYEIHRVESPPPPQEKKKLP